MRALIGVLTRCGLFTKDLDYRLLRGSMVVVFLFFGYTKWWEYGAQAMVLFITHGPFIFWLYPAFGFYGAARFLGTADWSSGLLLLSGFWNRKSGIEGDLASTVTFFTTVTIIPFIPNGWGGLRGRVSRDDRCHPLSHERRGAAGGLDLPAEAGCSAGVRAGCNDPQQPSWTSDAVSNR